MKTIQISLPDALHHYVEERMRDNDYADASEYFRDLLRADQKRRAKAALEESLLAALAAGDSEEVTPEWEDELREHVHNHTHNNPAKTR